MLVWEIVADSFKYLPSVHHCWPCNEKQKKKKKEWKTITTCQTYDISRLSWLRVCSPLPRQVLLEENVPAGLAPAHGCPWLAGLQHAHGARRVRQRAQVVADGARVGWVGVVERQLATVGAGPQVPLVWRRTKPTTDKAWRKTGN